MKFKHWNLSAGDPGARTALWEGGIPPLPAAVLCARGITTADAAARFLSWDKGLLEDPFLLRDMDKAVARIRQALQQKEIIAVYGDYDVDGITSTCLLTDYLRSEGASVLSYIPDRMEEGYGLNSDAVSALARQGVTLIITVDCGITACTEAETARNLGVSLIITDHHECKNALPAADAVVNPHRKDCPYPFKQLAGVGVALKLVLALGGSDEHTALFARYADLAAIGTVADVVDLTGENRAIVHMGLSRLANTLRPGLRALIREAGLSDKPLTASSVSYALAPRINASGRMGRASVSAELFLTHDPIRAEELAKMLCDLNRERQTIELSIYNECLDRLSGQESPPAIVLENTTWHQGVAGIVASRLAEKFSCPAFVICVQDGKGKGSCRSSGGFHLFAALEQCADLLDGFGGHALAAGFTIQAENIPAFRQRICDCVRATGDTLAASTLTIDAEISDLSLLDMPNVESLSLLEPYGAGNPRPVLSLSGVCVAALSHVGGDKHLKLRLTAGSKTLDAIFFSVTAVDAAVSVGDRIDLAFSPQINEFRGRRDLQLLGIDLRPALTRLQGERLLYEKLREGKPITPEEAKLLTPSRDDFANLWRYLDRQADCHCLVEDTAAHLSRCVSRTFGTRETLMRTMVCLDVMSEMELISLEKITDHLRIIVNSATGKVDLEQSALLRQLRLLSDL